MRQGLKNKILNYLKQEYPRIVHKGEIGRLAVNEWGYENECAGRRCRELENEGMIFKHRNDKNEAMYCYNILGSRNEQEHIEQVKKAFKDFEDKQITQQRLI